MATEDNKSPQEEKKAPSPSPAAASNDQFPIERILSEDECYALTGHERHIVVGALAGTKKTQLTTAEVQSAVTKWLSSPVKED